MQSIVSIVSYTFLPAKTGGEKGIALFYKYLSRYCRLTCAGTRANGKPDGNYTLVPVFSSSPFRYINPFLVFRIRRVVKKANAGFLEIEHPYFGWLGFIVSRITGTKLIVHSHNIEYARWKTIGKWWWPIMKGYEQFTHRKAHYNFFKTEEDRQSAIAAFGLNPACCTVITYGIEDDKIPPDAERNRCQAMLRQQYGISENATLFLFNGSLNYSPNLLALQELLDKINPLFEKQGRPYKLLICGKGLPEPMNGLKDYASHNVVYAGFVDDISIYFKGADVFVNPVTEGGGIQTKLVEALSYNLTVISSRKGATGIPLTVTGDKLQVVDNNDPQSFARAMASVRTDSDLPVAFFEHFNWDNIAAKASRFLAGDR
ncbi:MAG: glycosyltransferase family 4 protein [Bacteroidota bacterium]|nr:glycosyltransferase family 4 protein [Bacteroidota bacterium]